jgi:solute carrier family 45, member 1/2/4
VPNFFPETSVYDISPYHSGTVPLPTVFPFLGTTELQVLSVIVSLLLLSGQATMAVCVKERVLIESDHR